MLQNKKISPENDSQIVTKRIMKRDISVRRKKARTRFTRSTRTNGTANPPSYNYNDYAVRNTLIISGHCMPSETHCTPCCGPSRVISPAKQVILRLALENQAGDKNFHALTKEEVERLVMLHRRSCQHMSTHEFEILDVPGDGNCWVYSIFYSAKILSEISLSDLRISQPQLIRERIAAFLNSVDGREATNFRPRSYGVIKSNLQANTKNSVSKVLGDLFNLTPIKAVA